MLPLAAYVSIPVTLIVPALALMPPKPPTASRIGPSVSWSPGRVAWRELMLLVRLMLIVAYWDVAGDPAFWYVRPVADVVELLAKDCPARDRF